MASRRQAFVCVSTAFLCVLAVQAQRDFTCGVEGQEPCDGGCSAAYLPDGDLPSLDWYPESDNYVVAPAGYRQTEGLCTRCGNMYEPTCTTTEGKPLCFPGLYSGELLEPTDDGFCIPEEEQFGCGTSGKPLCADNAVNELGTLAIIQAPMEGTPWEVKPTLYELDGCIYNDHNPQLRFIPAPPAWLPEGHKCAAVCIHCGHIGEPPCPNQPTCHRRRSNDDPYRFLDGPVVDAGDVCEPLNCGGNTTVGAQPPCDAAVFSASLQGGDSNGDGCAEPFAIDNQNLCSGTAEVTSENPSKLEELENHCSHPSQILATAQMVQLLEDDGLEFVGEPGGCVPCGRNHEVPCNGMDFGGCYVNEGHILNTTSGLCYQSICGGLDTPLNSNFPFEVSGCGTTLPTYEKGVNPVNTVNNCLYFHNLNDEPEPLCEQCGWPGQRCNQECIYGIEWDPVGSIQLNVGKYKIRGDLRNPNHCEALVTVPLYPDGCPNPYASMVPPGDSDADIEASPEAVHKAGSEDPTFGTADNPDDTQHGLDDVPVPYVNVCPGGGKPNPKYTQCGGADWGGATCCFGYSVCVVKNAVFHQCENANVPSGVIPWHMTCADAGTEAVCELGSTCDGSYCMPDSAQIAGSNVSSSSGGQSTGATVGLVFLVLILCALGVIGGFFCGRRRGGGHQLLTSSKSYFGPSGGTRRRSKKHKSPNSYVDESLEPTEVTTLSMEDSAAADEFIDMRAAQEPVIQSLSQGDTAVPTKVGAKKQGKLSRAATSVRNGKGLSSIKTDIPPEL